LIPGPIFFVSVFVGYFSNIFNIVMLGLFILIGVLLGIFLRPWVGNRVLKMDPSTHRFNELDIEEETAISIYCKKKKGLPPQRFFKHDPGFTGIMGKFIRKPVTLFLGLMGTAYTWKPDQGSWKKLGKLGAAIKTVWGPEFYQTIPKRQRKILEKSDIQVTVGLKQGPITPPGYTTISEEDIKTEEDRKAAEVIWEEKRKQDKGQLINMILAAGTGFGVAVALMLLGIFTPIQAPAPPPPEVAQLILSLQSLIP